jgi:hypothetical protein
MDQHIGLTIAVASTRSDFHIQVKIEAVVVLNHTKQMSMNVVVVAASSHLVHVVIIIAIPTHASTGLVNKTHFLPPGLSAFVTKAGRGNTVSTDHVTTSRVRIKELQHTTQIQTNANAVVPMESVETIVKLHRAIHTTHVWTIPSVPSRLWTIQLNLLVHASLDGQESFVKTVGISVTEKHAKTKVY